MLRDCTIFINLFEYNYKASKHLNKCKEFNLLENIWFILYPNRGSKVTGGGGGGGVAKLVVRNASKYKNNTWDFMYL